jgi:hypothetical protein
MYTPTPISTASNTSAAISSRLRGKGNLIPVLLWIDRCAVACVPGRCADDWPPLSGIRTAEIKESLRNGCAPRIRNVDRTQLRNGRASAIGDNARLFGRSGFHTGCRLYKLAPGL